MISTGIENEKQLAGGGYISNVLDKNETTFLNSFNSYDNMKENKINP
jgi:hypothetical protein